MNELNDQNDQSLKIFVVLSRAYRSITDYTNKYIQQNDINPTEFGVLELLYHKGDQPLQHIGDKILLASGSITYVVDKLEKKKLIRRVACPNDRRVTFAQITDAGKKLIEDIFPDHQKRIDQIMEVLSEEEKRHLLDMLKKIGKSVPTE